MFRVNGVWAVLGAALVVVGVAGAQACGGSANAQDAVAESAPTAAAGAVPVVLKPGTPISMNDAQIVKFLSTANVAEINASKLALEQGTSPDLRDFAQRMVSEHAAANEQLKSLANKVGLKPADSDLSLQATQQGKQAIQLLHPLAGNAVDVAYSELEVASHAQLLFYLDTVMIPQAKDPEVRAAALSARSLSQIHLEVVEPLQANLGPKS